MFKLQTLTVVKSMNERMKGVGGGFLRGEEGGSERVGRGNVTSQSMLH